MRDRWLPILRVFGARWGFPLGVFLVTRLGLLLVAYFSLVLFPLEAWQVDNPSLLRGYPHNLALDGWTRWDSSWYWRIAVNGYSNLILDGQRDTRFFPLYPLLMRWGSFLTGNAYTAGLLISHTSFLLALSGLYGLTRERHDEGVARWTVILLAVFPFSFYSAAVYTESLFLATTVWAFYLAERKRWMLAALCAALSAVTRIPGCLVVPALMLVYLEQVDFRLRNLRPDVLWLLLALTLPAAHLYDMQTRFGDPFTFIRSHTGFAIDFYGHYNVVGAVASAARLESVLDGRYPVADFLHASSLILGCFSCLLALALPRRAWACWGLVYLLVGIPAWHSGGRYVSTVFPVFILWSRVLPTWLLGALAYVWTLGQAALLCGFTHFFWVG